MRYYAELFSNKTEERVAITDTFPYVVAAVREILQSKLPEKLRYDCTIITYSTDGLVISSLDMSKNRQEL